VRRILATSLLLAVAAAAAFALMGAGGSGPKKPHYTVELDNAFGIVRGADLKIAGVRAGKVKKLSVDRTTHRALVDFEINKDGFGSIRKDVTCETRPQSLIGEYYIDCNPGKDPHVLPSGSRIPVQQTTSTIPIDLVNNVLRRPYRERLAIILDELGVGVAGRAQEINEAVRRASPALRETDRVLGKLATQNQTLKQLVTDADKVIGDLAANRHDVGRWVVETKQTAAASAERRSDIAAGLHRLPTFLRELRPTMADLGAAADTNTPAWRNLHASADQLALFLQNLKPFVEASRVNLRSLAAASRKGRPAARAARPVVAELARGTKKAPELANNASIVLRHLNNRKHAVEKDPRSPGGKGYTGLEAILQWFFDQSQAINIYDKNGYILKVDLFHSKCSDYQNLKTLREKMASDPNFYKDCAAILGPNQPGITQPDPTATGRQFASISSRQAGAKSKKKGSRAAGKRHASRHNALDKIGRETGRRRKGLSKRAKNIERELGKRLQDQLGIDLPDVPGVPSPNVSKSLPPLTTPQGGSGVTTQQLLDYLLGP
jgi:virulence factor Mce-like protein